MVAKIKRNRKETTQTLIFSIFLGTLALGVISVLVISNFRISQRRTELISKIENLQKEIENLEKRKEELKAGISQTEKESYWEERIREQGYKKPGEEQVVVLPPKTEEKTPEQKTLWQKILETIGF